MWSEDVHEVKVEPGINAPSEAFSLRDNNWRKLKGFCCEPGSSWDPYEVA